MLYLHQKIMAYLLLHLLMVFVLMLFHQYNLLIKNTAFIEAPPSNKRIFIFGKYFFIFSKDTHFSFSRECRYNKCSLDAFSVNTIIIFLFSLFGKWLFLQIRVPFLSYTIE